MAISSDVQLSVYNEALRMLGERRLAGLAEAREPRRVLDDAWTGAVAYALEQGDWNFAIRSSEVAWSPDFETSFGFRRAFAKPFDFVRLSSLAADEYFRIPLVDAQYVDEAGFWLSDFDTLYVRYVSSGDAYGFNSGGWPETFKKYLAAYLSAECCERITNSTQKRDRAERAMKMALTDARSSDAMNEGVKFAPPGSWVMARGGGWGARGRRG